MPETPSETARLPVEIDDRIDPSLVTAHAGVPLVIELFDVSAPRRLCRNRSGSNNVSGG